MCFRNDFNIFFLFLRYFIVLYFDKSPVFPTPHMYFSRRSCQSTPGVFYKDMIRRNCQVATYCTKKYQKSTNIIPLCPPIFSVLNFCSGFLLWSIARPLDQRCEDFWEGSKSLSNVTRFYSHKNFKSLASYSRLGRLRWM